MATEKLDGAVALDLKKRVVVITARPRGLIVQPPVEIAVPIATLKAVLSQVLLIEAQAEDANAVLSGSNATAQNGSAPKGLAISR
jgi:hypothetical protein